MSTETTAADDWAETFEGQVLDGRYEIEGLLGAGGMGAVFRGRQIQLRKPVAVKLLRPEYGHRKIHRERFLREARAASRIGHRNVVDISDFGETADGRVFFVMELLEGEDLARALRREGAMPWRRARGILLQIVRALKAAHAKSVIHRDVKPANIFLVKTTDDEPDEVKVLDFGVAKVTDPADSAAEGLTSADKVMGTAMYMAPEQALGKVADARSDVYAVGCVAYQMLAGRPAFSGTNALEILMRRINEPAPSLGDEVPHIAAVVEAFVRRAMARDPMARFQTMKEMEDAIREIPAEIESRGPEPQTRPSSVAARELEAPTSTSARRAATPTPRGLTERFGATPPSGVPTEAIDKPSSDVGDGPLTEPAVPAARAGLDTGMPPTSPSLAIDEVTPPVSRSTSRVGIVLVPALVGVLALGAWMAWDRRGDGDDARVAARAGTTADRAPGGAPAPEDAKVDSPVDARPSPEDPPPSEGPPAAVQSPAHDAADATPKSAVAEPPTTAPPGPASPVEPAPKAASKPAPKATKPRPKKPVARDVERTSKALAAKARSTCAGSAGTSVAVSFNIETSGKPAAVRVPSGTDADLATCLRGLVRGARFGEGDVEAATLVVTW
jgi:serine/threonine protein kinase